MLIGNPIAGRFAPVDAPLMRSLARLEFLVVSDAYADTPLGTLADVILPQAMSMELDGTYTSFDRTVQRLRVAVPPMGEAKSAIDVLSSLSQRLGYVMGYRRPAQVMDEIAKLVPGYAGISYARLERSGISVPTRPFADAGSPIFPVASGEPGSLRPRLIAAASGR